MFSVCVHIVGICFTPEKGIDICVYVFIHDILLSVVLKLFEQLLKLIFGVKQLNFSKPSEKTVHGKTNRRESFTIPITM